MVSVIAIDHIVLNTFDKYNAMLTFYCKTLGCEIERELPEFQLTQLRAGHSIIDLIGTPLTCENPSALPSYNKNENKNKNKNKNKKNMEHFCLTIKQKIDQTLIKKLTALNIKTSNINNNYGAQGMGNSIYIEDPCGNTVELKQHNEKSKISN